MVFRTTVLLGILLSFVDTSTAINPSEVMTGVSQAFGRAILNCQKKMNFPVDSIEKMRHFWQLDNASSKKVACVIHCAMEMQELIDYQGDLHQPNAIALLRANGADDIIAMLLMKVVTKDCATNTDAARTSVRDVPNHCRSAFLIGDCLRNGIQKLNIVLDDGVYPSSLI